MQQSTILPLTLFRHRNRTATRSGLQAHTRQWRDIVTAAGRGFALFLGGFTLLNLVRQWIVPGFDANIWWIDLGWLPASIGSGLLVMLAAALLWFGLNPQMCRYRTHITLWLCCIAAIAVGYNILGFYLLLVNSAIITSFPFPLSLFILLSLTIIAVGVLNAGHAQRNRPLLLLATVGISLFLFPLLQILCFGTTDYRRTADTIVVFGAKTFADGTLSIVLADRVRTGVELWKQGYAQRIIFSGGPGEGAVHETEAMRRLALYLGVPDSAIILDRHGLSTRETAENTVQIFHQHKTRRVLAVSNFFHLPRIKMTYQQEGWEVFTVPAKEHLFSGTPWQLTREVIGLWAYYWGADALDGEEEEVSIMP